ncbi:MAG: hypothetical protein SYC29_12515, partial [Planctomycetota bacterium]|nr:hypothetical protein [Planctomycetota bacterium]
RDWLGTGMKDRGSISIDWVAGEAIEHGIEFADQPQCLLVISAIARVPLKRGPRRSEFLPHDREVPTFEDHKCLQSDFVGPVQDDLGQEHEVLAAIQMQQRIDQGPYVAGIDLLAGGRDQPLDSAVVAQISKCERGLVPGLGARRAQQVDQTLKDVLAFPLHKRVSGGSCSR